jgi:hypothetical protein
VNISKARIGVTILLLVGGILGIASFASSLNNLIDAEKNLGYEYGRCVFYDEIGLEKCNSLYKSQGLELYEKYYGDGSWTVEADPIPN